MRIKPHIILLAFILLTSCSTTRNLPDGETLYTGIDRITYVDSKENAITPIGEEAINEITATLDCPPNASIAGSSRYRTIPVGLWVYNNFVNNKGKIGRWIFKTFATTPVLLSNVNPTLRAQVATNRLQNYGYFHGQVSEEIVYNKKNPRKAKVNYTIQLNEPYTYDSIEYRGFSSRADSLIAATSHEQMLLSGEQFSVPNLTGERNRLNTLLRNNGYYYYQSSYIDYLADTINHPGHVTLRVEPHKGLPSYVRKPKYMGRTTLKVTKSGYTNYGEKPDTTTFRNLTYIFNGKKAPVRAGTILRNVQLRPGTLYSQEKQSLTLQQLSQLNIFSSLNFAFTPRGGDTANDTLDMTITAQLDKPYDFTFELNATSKSNSQLGPGSKVTLSRNNLFRGGETLKFSLFGSYEWQTDDNVRGREAVINSWEIGSNISLTLPRILFPFVHRRYLRFPSSTSFSIYGNQLNRSGFFKMVHVGGQASYTLTPKRTTTHTITPFRLTYDMLQRTTAKFDSIVSTNRSIANSFRDQFIPAMQYTVTYDNAKTRHRNKTWWENSLTSSGNITSLLFCAFGEKWNEKNKNLFENPYAQFIKYTTELRNLYRINSNNHIATRLMAGVITSYGNSTTVPYSEQFYIGGANSLRAFTVRSLGPGGFHPVENTRYSYLDETGTLKFEANLEYRTKLFGNLQGALFLDAGNIWLMKKDANRPGGEITLKNFADQIALNTGFGVRYDLEFLVLRFDVGIALHYPYDTGKSGYYNIPSFNKGYAWHFAIGYPF